MYSGESVVELAHLHQVSCQQEQQDAYQLANLIHPGEAADTWEAYFRQAQNPLKVHQEEHYIDYGQELDIIE